MSLIYNKTNWKDDKTTPVNAKNLNNIEDGIEYVYHKWDKIIQDSTTGDHAAELIDARYGPNDTEEHPTLGHRLNHMDNKFQDISSQLAHIESISLTLKDNNTNTFISTLNKLKNGGTLILNNKNEIEITETINLDGFKNVVIKGASSNKIKIKDGLKITGFKFTNCENITFENITFDGQGHLENIDDFGNYFINYCENSINLTIDKCTFKNITDVCILDRSQPMSNYNGGIVTKISNAIITNNRFLNCKHSYLTKGGGSKNIIYTNNIHKDCLTGIKLDGEITGSDYFDDINGDTGTCIISNNIFENTGSLICKSAGLNAICVEERVSNVIISNNIINGANYINGLAISTGQTCSYVKDVIIENNIFTNIRNADGLFIGEFNYSSDSEVSMENITISNNSFKNIDFAGIRTKLPNLQVKNLNIKANTFTSCGLLGYASVYLEGNNLELIDIINNIFYVDLESKYKRQIHLISNNTISKFFINNNTIHCNRTGTGDSDFEEVIIIENCDKVILQNNLISRGFVTVNGSKVDIINNKFNEGCIKIFSKNEIKSDVKVISNIFIQEFTTSAYYLRIGDGYENHKVVGNLYSKTYVDCIYKPNGNCVDSL